jgi:hypothetical protein
MGKVFFIFGVVLFFAIRAVAILNPSEDINFDCMNPFVIAKVVSFGSSGILTKAGDLYDKKRSGSTGVICTCDRVPVPQVGIPFGMSLPTHIFESTLKPYYFPSLEEAGEAGETVEGYGDMDSDDISVAYTYTHLVNLDLGERIKEPLYLLSGLLRDKFYLRYTPSIVKQEGNRLVIYEYYLDEAEQ